ncbi:MAG: glycosyltransferase family A protein [Cognaticolwellia sp.]
MQYSISVIVPFYRAEEFFEYAYNSIKAQTITPHEIIVVIDGFDIQAEQYLKAFEGIKIISLERNGGPSKARNIGVKSAKGHWIAFMDADDKWAPEKLEKQLIFLKRNVEFSSCHTAVKTFTNQDIIATFDNKPIILTIEDLLVSSQVVPSSWLIKKSVFEEIDGFDTNIKCSEDHEITLRLVAAGEKIGFLKEPLALLRREQHGHTSSNGRNFFIGHQQLLKKHKTLYNQHPKLKHLFMYKTCMTAGSKRTGLEKNCYYLLGKIIKNFYNIRV